MIPRPLADEIQITPDVPCVEHARPRHQSVPNARIDFDCDFSTAFAFVMLQKGHASGGINVDVNVESDQTGDDQSTSGDVTLVIGNDRSAITGRERGRGWWGC